MSEATIKYRDYQFQVKGRPQYGAEGKYEADAPHGAARRKVTTYTIQQWFLEESFGDNEARYREMLAALSVPEGVLFIADENGTVLVNARVRVLADQLPPQWGQYVKQVDVKFEAMEKLAGATPFDATFTIAGDPNPTVIVLNAVAKFREEVRAERYSRHVDNRREAVGNVTMSGVVRADPQLEPAARRAFLLSEKERLMGVVDGKSGTLQYGDFSREVRVSQFDADAEDGTDQLEWILVADYLRFPAGNYAEAEYRVQTSDNLERAERMTVVSGRITAFDEDGARAKRDQLRGIFAGAGRMLLRSELSPAATHGEDAESGTGDNVGLYDFALEWREILPGAVVRFRLNVSDRTDQQSGIITSTASGSVVAATSAAALAKARQLGGNLYPIKISDSETVSSIGGDTAVSGSGMAAGSDETAQFTECTFSYEYQRRGTARHAEVTMETSREHFGNSSQSVTGYTSAVSAEDAMTWARTFRPTGVLMLSERESTVNAYHAASTGGAPSQLFQRVNFSYAAFLAALNGTMEYGVETSEDFNARETTVTYNGRCWADTETNANALIDTLVAGLIGRRSVNKRASSFKRKKTGSAVQDVFESRQFTVAKIMPLSASGDDILEAEYSIESTYSVDHAVITPIPFGIPHVQPACGITPGRKVVSGMIVALNLGTAQGWARAKKPTGGVRTEQDAPRENETLLFYPMSGTQVRAYRIQFTYPMTYQNLASPV